MYRGSTPPEIKIILRIVIFLFASFVFIGEIYSMFPLKYYDEIKISAQKYSLDPHLVMAMIKAESDFREDATSPKGAKGLMQLTDETALWCADKLGMKEFEIGSIYDPALNIEMGCYFFAYLLERFGGELSCAIAAYNAGFRNVEKWLKDESCSSDRATLSDIPFPETRRYVKKTMWFYKVYKLLYPGH